MSEPIPASRPGSVTTVIVLTWIAAILDIIGGIVFVALAGNSTFTDALGVDKTAVTVSGVVTLVVGIVTALVALMLGAGAPLGRILVSLVMVLRIGVGIYGIVALGVGGATSAIVTIVFAVLILVLLWNAAANKYFAR